MVRSKHLRYMEFQVGKEENSGAFVYRPCTRIVAVVPVASNYRSRFVLLAAGPT